MIEIDTDRLREQGQKLESLICDYYKATNKIFNRITNMPTVTGEWVGVSAERFSKNASVDSKQYAKFYSTAREYSTYLKVAAEKVENLCRTVKKK